MVLSEEIDDLKLIDAYEMKLLKRYDKNIANHLASPLVVLFLLIIPVAADGTPPGDYGMGTITMGVSANDVYIVQSSDVSNWLLDPTKGVNTIDGLISVKADGDWKVVATDSDPITAGQMTEWDGSSYVSNPKKLSAMRISATDPGDYVDAVSEKTIPTTEWIVIGSDTLGNYITIPVTFKQPVYWSNQVLTGGHCYRIVITFTISGY